MREFRRLQELRRQVAVTATGATKETNLTSPSPEKAAANERNIDALQLELDTELVPECAAQGQDANSNRGLYVFKNQSEKTPHVGSFAGLDSGNQQQLKNKDCSAKGENSSYDNRYPQALALAEDGAIAEIEDG